MLTTVALTAGLTLGANPLEPLVAAPHLRIADISALGLAGVPSPRGGRPYGAELTDVSEFLIGRVALAVILPSSDGSIDPDTEDWTRAEVEAVLRGVREGLRFWLGRGPGELDFAVEFDGLVPTGYEPISRPTTDESLWVSQVLEKLGHGEGGALARAYDRVDRLIFEQQADWGGLLFFVDSSNDDGYFADGWSAYAYFGGPYLITPTTPAGDPIETLDSYVAHEGAHLFYADDEYLWAMSGCDVESGYLSVPNGNSEFGNCPLAVDCIMKYGYLPATRACGYTLAQTGRHDLDGDGLPAPIDTEPSVAPLWTPPDTVTLGEPVTIAVRAEVNPLPNRNTWGNGHDVTINRIAAVESRLDGEPWVSRPAWDGGYDNGIERAGWRETGLGIGAHSIEVRAINNVGNESETPLRIDFFVH
ncbi:MAG: hypothetical protein CME06_15420 [Gemmatimonadetes bacterium]|nr:hypothetical protein [Gemmatimonadota bacterium]